MQDPSFILKYQFHLSIKSQIEWEIIINKQI